MSVLRGHILIVDDLETNRLSMARLLKREGLGVETAGDGIVALEMARKGAFDMILLDVMMPRMDGFQTLMELKREPALADIPVIMLSALHEASAVRECIEAGADDYLFKPLDHALLRARLSSCLRRKALQDQEKRYKQRMEALNEELGRLNVMKSRFLAMAAHDLKHPLMLVLCLAEQMLAEKDKPLAISQSTKIGQDIQHSVNRMLGILQALLDHAALEENPVSSRQSLDLGQLVLGVVEEHRAYADSKKIHLRADIQHPARIDVDEFRVRQVVTHLLDNAIKFSPSGTEVLVRLSTHPDKVQLSVLDQGPGLSADDKAHLFVPYQRLSARPTAGESSTGLGLVLVKRHVEAHGGRVWAEDAPEKGAAFFAEFPV